MKFQTSAVIKITAIIWQSVALSQNAPAKIGAGIARDHTDFLSCFPLIGQPFSDIIFWEAMV
jgi:hypothetical protein